MQTLSYKSVWPIGLISSLLIGIVLFLFSGCGKDKVEPEPEYPPIAVETSALSFLTPISAELTGKAKNDGKQEVLDHGFAYGYGTDADFATGRKISLGPGVVSGFFKATVTDLQFPPSVNGKPVVLLIKAYVTDKNGTRYGSVYSTNYKDILTSGINIKEGKSGDMVTITGRFGGLKTTDVEVTFENTPGKVISISETQVTVEIPSNIQAAHGAAIGITVRVGVVFSSPVQGFLIWANIKDMSPKSGPIGTKVVLRGDNLPSATKVNSLAFENVVAHEFYEDGYYVRIPAGINKEKAKLSYRKEENWISLPLEFTITPPVIKSITPNPALNQQIVAMHLDNTDPNAMGEGALIEVGSLSTRVLPDQNGDMVFRLGSDLKAGQSYPVTVSYGPHTVTSAQPIKIEKIEASSFSPSRGFAGTQLHVTGKFAKGGNYAVDFGGDYLPGTAVSETEVIVRIPLGITNKNYNISVRDESSVVKLPGVFEGQATRFDGISPASGPPGTKFTLSGQGFYITGLDQLSINLGGPVAGASSISLTKIVIDVPNFTPPGKYPIKFDLGWMILDTGFFFTVTE